MSKTPFMPLWVGDFLAKTSDLDAKEAGAYLLLLMAMWTRDGTLPDDQKKLQRIARVGRDWPKVWDAIKHYFTAKDGTISNDRLAAELAQVRAKRAVNSHAGALGGRAKALKEKNSAIANATVSLKQSEPYSEREEERGKPLSVRGGEKPSRFDEFWNAYPHRGGSKKGRKPSEAKYAAAVKSGVPEQIIIDGAIRARGDPQVVKGYARNPETWLSQAGWNDEIQPYPPEPPKGSKDGWTNAWQSALADARVADRQGDGAVIPLLHPGNRSCGGKGASGGLVRYPLGRAAGSH